MSIILNGTTGITTPDITSTTSTLGSLTQALDLGSTGQIVFPATQSASSNANTLDDYEEGTWTPTVASGTGSITSYTSNGWYIKIGKSVTITGYFQLTNVGSASTGVVVAGLPFTPSNFSFPAGNRNAVGICREDAITGLIYQMWAQGNSTSFNIQSSAGGYIAWTNNYVYVWTVTYQANS